jgi:hypothetical protein
LSGGRQVAAEVKYPPGCIRNVEVGAISLF